MHNEIKLGYTIIQHAPRLQYALSNNEYCIADAIYHLSHNPASIAPGWCFARREKLGIFFGLSRRTIINGVGKLKQKGLIEVNGDTSYLRTTSTWYDDFVLFSQREREKYRV